MQNWPIGLSANLSRIAQCVLDILIGARLVRAALSCSYNLEISGHELVVRDDRGAVIETVPLDGVDGEFRLPNGQQVDLASLFLSNEVNPEDFETAAGSANDNAGGKDGGPLHFRAFQGEEESFTGEDGAGTLSNTSLSYVLIDDDQKKTDDAVFTETSIPVDWASHEQWSIPENQDGGDFGRLVDGDPRDFTFKVSDDRFDVVDGVLQLKDGFSFDFETESFIDVQITVVSQDRRDQDRGDPYRRDRRERRPDRHRPDNALVAENVAGAVIGKITVSDPDAGDQQNFSLSDGRSRSSTAN